VKKILLSTVFALFATAAHATCAPPLAVKDGAGASQNLSVGVDPSGNCLYNFGNSAAVTNPTSTLTLPATTTAYTSGQQIGAAGASFSIPNTAGGFYLPALLLTSNDTAANIWAGVIIQIDLWRAAPTLGGDRTAYAVTAGSANYLGSYSCTMAGAADGGYAACAPLVGTTPSLRLASGTSVFWTPFLFSRPTGIATGASKTLTLTAELSN